MVVQVNCIDIHDDQKYVKFSYSLLYFEKKTDIEMLVLVRTNTFFAMVSI